MKAGLIVLLFAVAFVECYPKKIFVPISKTANIDFINMEGGGANKHPAQPASAPASTPAKPAQSLPTPAKPAVQPVPVKPAVQPAPAKPVTPTLPTSAKLTPVQPNARPAQPAPVTPVPVYPALPSKTVTTPGPGSVKQLITFYDSQGKASVIRPHTYSQAVKQG